MYEGGTWSPERILTAYYTVMPRGASELRTELPLAAERRLVVVHSNVGKRFGRAHHSLDSLEIRATWAADCRKAGSEEAGEKARSEKSRKERVRAAS